MNVQSLIDSVTKSIGNFQEKHDFLAEQQEHYIQIREKVLAIETAGDDAEYGEEKSYMFGDVIISPGHIYLNLGYEYYVEKTRDEIKEYLKAKLELMEEAMKQFVNKMNEANKTLKDLCTLKEAEKEPIFEEDADFGYEDEGLPSMEIREELDEYGNVINSTVTPTKDSVAYNLNGEKKETDEDDAKPSLSSFEQSLQGKLSSKISEVPKVQEAANEDKNAIQVTQRSIPMDTADMYTFADLIQQMDEQDEKEGGLIEDNKINYNYDAFENSENDQSENEEEDDYYYDNGMGFTMIPGTAAQSSFMDQINKLRSMKASEYIPREEDSINILEKYKDVDKFIPKKERKIEEPTKPILKKNEKKKNEKKSVGFAASLDIHEIENLKEETKQNTHKFPRYGGMVSKINDEDDTFVANDEFDSELFAQLLGVQGPEELHEKFKNDLEKEHQKEQLANESKRKNRVSRFKLDRDMKEPTAQTCITSDLIEKEVSVTSDIIEKEVSVTSDIVEKNVPVTSDITKENIPLAYDIIEKDSIAPINHSNTKNIPSSTIKSINLTGIFGKKMASLEGPKHSGHQHSTKLSKELLEYLENDSEEEDQEKFTNEQTGYGTLEEQVHRPTNFPDAINDAIKEINHKTIKVPNIDFSALGDDIDNMANAYLLGIYDDDLEDDPGMLVEKLADFKKYNIEVNQLKDTIEKFKIDNPFPTGENHADEEADSDGEMMVDITENDIPENYDDNDKEDDYGVQLDYLNESIKMEYHKLKSFISTKIEEDIYNFEDDDEAKGIEPIDETGAPIRESRFKSRRLKLSK